MSQLGVVAHEVGHAIGFEHEQSRPDRDKYVVVNLENIHDDMEESFEKYGKSIINNQNVEYDYSSDMHYGSTVSDCALRFTLITRTCDRQFCVLRIHSKSLWHNVLYTFAYYSR